MAPDKKTPHDVAPISSSSMKAASSSFPTFAGPGHRAARPRVCATATAATASRSAAGWWSRPGGGAWRSISAVAPAISPASTSARSCTTCSATCAVPWSCSGTAAASTGAWRFGRSSSATRACASMTFPRTRRSSTPRSMCGPRLIRRSPMAPPTISANSGTDWTPPSDASAAPSPCSGHASTPRISLGHGDGFIPLFTQRSIIERAGKRSPQMRSSAEALREAANKRLQRTARRAAAEPWRWPPPGSGRAAGG